MNRSIEQFLQDLIAEGDALRNQPSVKEELTDLDEEDDEWDVYVSVQGHSRWVTKIRAFLYEMTQLSRTFRRDYRDDRSDHSVGGVSSTIGMLEGLLDLDRDGFFESYETND